MASILSYTYTYTLGRIFPHEVSRTDWFEEGMYPSLPVIDNKGSSCSTSLNPSHFFSAHLSVFQLLTSPKPPLDS